MKKFYRVSAISSRGTLHSFKAHSPSKAVIERELKDLGFKKIEIVQVQDFVGQGWIDRGDEVESW